MTEIESQEIESALQAGKNLTDKEQNQPEAEASSSSSCFAKKSDNNYAAGVRRYDMDYLKSGFFWNEDYKNPLPLCLFCKKLFACNEMMAPNKLHRHLESCTNYKKIDKEIINSSYLKIKLDEFKKSQKQIKKFSTDPIKEKTTLVSFKLANLIAKKRKPYVEGEKILKPCLELIAETMFEPKSDEARALKLIPLSAKTIKNRTLEIAEDLKDQLTQKLKGKVFALQLDESTDTTNHSQLQLYVRFEENQDFVEEYLKCVQLKNSTGMQIFLAVCNVFNEFGLKWENCYQVCADGCPSMKGDKKGFIGIVRRRFPHIKFNHCLIHREVLVTKVLPSKLNDVMNKLIKMINYIKTSPLKTTLFEELAKEMGEKFIGLLNYTDIRWLSRGNALKRLWILRDVVLEFFTQRNETEFVACLHDPEFMSRFSWLVDILEEFNKLNVNLQGKAINIFEAEDYLKSFKKQLALWHLDLMQGNLEGFQTFIHNSIDTVVKEAADHLVNVGKRMKIYFPKLETNTSNWIINPYYQSTPDDPFPPPHLNLSEKTDLIKLRDDRAMKLKFNKKKIEKFWLEIDKSKYAVAQKAINCLTQFPTTYLCETGFSAMIAIKTEERSSLKDLDQELRVCISKLNVRFEKLAAEKQHQGSH